MFEERTWLTEELRTLVFAVFNTNTALLHAVESKDLLTADSLRKRVSGQRGEIASLRLRLAKHTRSL